MSFISRRQIRSLPLVGDSSTRLIYVLLTCSILLLWSVAGGQGRGSSSQVLTEMTEEKALMLAEEFGLDVGEVDEEIKKILGLTQAEGVVVFAVIGATAAYRAGIKVKAIIKEVDGKEIKTLIDLGKALEKALPTQNFSVATYEPAGVDDQGIGGGLNFHFVRIEKE